MPSDIKHGLLQRIADTSDENLLQRIKAEMDYFTSEGNADVFDPLSQEDEEELKNLLSEPFANKTETLEDFKKATER